MSETFRRTKLLRWINIQIMTIEDLMKIAKHDPNFNHAYIQAKIDGINSLCVEFGIENDELQSSDWRIE